MTGVVTGDLAMRCLSAIENQVRHYRQPTVDLILQLEVTRSRPRDRVVNALAELVRNGLITVAPRRTGRTDAARVTHHGAITITEAGRQALLQKRRTR